MFILEMGVSTSDTTIVWESFTKQLILRAYQNKQHWVIAFQQEFLEKK